MPFSKIKKRKDAVELVSLIDMIFILLIFFLVTSYVIQMPLQERKLGIPTPENELGRAQIVLQFINEGSIVWLDQSVSGTVESMENELGYLTGSELQRRIVERLIQDNTNSMRGLRMRISRLKNLAKASPNQKFFVLIRCPNDLPYYKIIQTIASLVDPETGNIQYGCVGGDLSEIQNCRRIYTVLERDGSGRLQKNIRIDF